MNPTLITTLVGRAGEMTRRNNQPASAAAASLAPYVGRSPIEEILVEEHLAGAPKELADALRQAPNVASVRDVAGVIAIYQMIAHDPALATQYLATLRTDSQLPRQAGLAIAQTIAARLDPPPRSGLRLFLDRVGVACQLLGAAALVVIRALLFGAAVAYNRGLPLTQLWSAVAGVDFQALCRQAAGLELHAFAWHGPDASIALSLTLIYAYLEFHFGPGLLEAVRGLPSSLFALPPPQPWRTSEFGVLLRTQSFAVLLVVYWTYGRCLLTWLPGASWPQMLDSKLAIAGLVFAGLAAVQMLLAPWRSRC